jgi:beta-glucosidase
LARELSANATVLVQNRNNVLPLDATSLKTIAVIGNQAGPDTIFGGGGSGTVKPSFVVYPLAGIKAALGFPADHVFNTDAKDCNGDMVGACNIYVTH